jgi:hypothetical protein
MRQNFGFRKVLIMPAFTKKRSFIELAPNQIPGHSLMEALKQNIFIKKQIGVINIRGLDYKTFYDPNLRIFVISWSVCPWQASPALSNVCG